LSVSYTHLNDTYRAEFRHAGVSAHYILQRINSNIFKNPAAVMENIQRVTDHLAAQVAGEPDSRRRVLSLIPTRDGRSWHVDAEAGHWRAYHFIDNARTYDAVESTEQAFQAGKAFGHFQMCIRDSRIRQCCPGPGAKDEIRQR